MRLSFSRVTMFVSLLAFAASASAECAWVLWQQTRLTTLRPPATDTWDIHGVFEKKAECEAELPRHERLDRQTSGYDANTRATTVVRHVCLPDTIDPRGSKGK
jgi:hypothetical protein